MRLPTIVLALVMCAASVGVALLVANIFGAESRGDTASAQPLPTLVVTGVKVSTAVPQMPTAAPTLASTVVPTTVAPTRKPAPTLKPAPTRKPAPIATSNPTVEPSATTTSNPTVEPSATAQVTYIEYTVKRGDSLLQIARTYNVTAEAILALNAIPNSDSLTIGQVLRIPRAE